MKITPDTKVSVLIKNNPGSVEAIATMAKPFEKLRNPVLRKLMAPRITIAEAAKIGGVAVSDFVKVLLPLGFEFDDTAVSGNQTGTIKEPEWLLKAKPQNIQNFDVRELLDSGKDPFGQIMEKYNCLEPGNILCVINSFAPTPLIEILNNKGAQSYLQQVSPQVYYSYFIKPVNNKKPASAGNEMGTMVNEEEFNELKMRFGDRKTDIDVRNMEMPVPMQKILEALETLPSTYVLNVMHKRVPVYLLEALADKDYQIIICNIAEGDVRLLISKSLNYG